MSADNFLRVWEQALSWEKEEGAAYYDNQRERIALHAREVISALPLERCVGAFAVLSPNNDEASNYKALRRCCLITVGALPQNAKVNAYGRDRNKALGILAGEPLDQHLRGRKVSAFYHNTLHPDDSTVVTIDGHMFGAWKGKRYPLKKVPNIWQALYQEISSDMQEAAARCSLSAPRFQAVIWLAWKRLNRILDYRYAQLTLPLTCVPGMPII